MANISFVLESRTNKQGLAQVRLRVTNKGTRTFLVTGVYIEPQYFQDSLYDPVHRKAYMSVEKREQLLRYVREYDQWMADADPMEVKQLTAQDIKERVWRAQASERADARAQEDVLAEAKKNAKPRTANDVRDFVVFFEKYGDAREAENTRKSYAYAWRVLMEYCKARGLQTLFFDDINYQRLGDLARWLRDTGKGESARHMVESYVRSAYKEAMKLHIVDRTNDPYFDYSIAPVPPKDIDALTAEQMRALMDVDLSDVSGLERARDCAMMSFYLCGANLLDIFNLPPMSGEVVFVRSKVQRASMRATRIRIEPELHALLDKYKGTEYLLRFAEGSPNYATFQRKITLKLEGVSKRLGFKVTMAMVRRSWASIAGSLDISDRVIDKSMGHVDKSVKDKHYEQYDWARTARANRMVIDAIKSTR